MTLRFYDVSIDGHREPTQADIDGMASGVAAFGMLREGLKALLDDTLRVARGETGPIDVAAAIKAWRVKQPAGWQ